MGFQEVLEQALTLLQRRGRMTYRTFKQPFQLDDEAVKDLKAEVISGLLVQPYHEHSRHLPVFPLTVEWRIWSPPSWLRC